MVMLILGINHDPADVSKKCFSLALPSLSSVSVPTSAENMNTQIKAKHTEWFCTGQIVFCLISFLISKMLKINVSQKANDCKPTPLSLNNISNIFCES